MICIYYNNQVKTFMGIPKLNKYLLERCGDNCISKQHISTLRNKIIVIDVSIYLYKFISHGELLQDMYLFISILLHYNIIPIFVFDGKPPPEKKELLIMRNNDKRKAEQECKLLTSKLNEDISKLERDNIEIEISNLKKRCIRVRNSDIIKVKTLLKAYGVCYLDAKNEADELCGYLTSKDIAYGCVSDDMDMFMYNCNFVIRHISLLNHTMIIYNVNNICETLNVTRIGFRKILVLSGTDYNVNNHINIYDVFKWYTEYISNGGYSEFYNYVNENKKDINTDEITKIDNFINYNNYNDEYLDKRFNNEIPNIIEIKEILKPEGFFWID